MSTILSAAPAQTLCAVVIDERLRIPAGINDLDAFRRWAHSDDFPEQGRIAFLDGTLWIDLTLEQAFSHNEVKHEVASVLRGIAKAARVGRYFGDGMRLSHLQVNLSTDSDGLFFLFPTLKAAACVRCLARPAAWSSSRERPTWCWRW